MLIKGVWENYVLIDYDQNMFLVT